MSLESQKMIFALLFRVSNQLQIAIDQTLKDDQLTAKQFLLMIVIHSFESAPSLNDIAERFGSSRQNAKQLVNKLITHHYVQEIKDLKDKRTLRFSLTPKAMEYWSKRDPQDIGRFDELFKDIDAPTLEVLLKGLSQLMKNMEDMTHENPDTI